MASDPTDPDAPTEVLRASGVATPAPDAATPPPATEPPASEPPASEAGAPQAEAPVPDPEAAPAAPSSGARARFARATASARGRASSADVKHVADSTTSLIDNARPFFLAFAAACFAVLGFFEGDSGTSQLFVFGALVCVLGAAFSRELNAFIADRAHDPDGKH